jgi:lysozyme family protein
MSVWFEKAAEVIVAIEGGYVNDPNDPGGETKYGISKRTFPGLDIKNLSKQEAVSIYYNDFWTPAKCDKLAWPLCLFVLDTAVHSGQGTAIKLLQRAAGVAADGILGPNTMKAVERQNAYELGALYMAERALCLTGTRNFDKYGRGWLKRLFLAAMEV